MIGDALHRRQLQDAGRVELAGIGAPPRQRRADLGQRPVEDAGDVEEAQAAGVAFAQHVTRPSVSSGRQLSSLPARAPNHSMTVESGIAAGARRATSRATGTVTARRRRAAQHDAVADDGDVPVAVAAVSSAAPSSGEAQPGDAPAQQRRRHQRADEDDDQQGGVLVVAEHALGETDRREDEPDLASRDHADADEQPVDADAAGAAGRRRACR